MWKYDIPKKGSDQRNVVNHRRVIIADTHSDKGSD